MQLFITGELCKELIGEPMVPRRQPRIRSGVAVTRGATMLPIDCTLVGQIFALCGANLRMSKNPVCFCENSIGNSDEP